MTTKPPRLDDFRQKISWRDVEKSQDLENLLKICIREDLNPGKVRQAWEYDLTSEVCNLQGSGTAQLTCREPLILCGVQLADLLIETFLCDQLKFQTHLE
ncbi:MAG: hypothetical protein O3B07_07630, partial [Verrucomicrobia bacterium]|nr:hypothetical protein [Verrucomicrobiota bacterium]